MVGAGVRLGPAFRRPHLDLADDAPFQVHQVGLHRGPQGQDGRGGVAPYPAHVPGLAQFLPVQFGQAVDEAGQPFRGRMGMAVPAFVQGRVLQAEVRGKVDNVPAQGNPPVDVLLGLAVGQGQEEHIRGFQRVRVDELEPGALAQVGMYLIHVVPRVLAGRRLLHFHMGVVQEQPQQFAAGVPRSPHDGDPYTFGHGTPSSQQGANGASRALSAFRDENVANYNEASGLRPRTCRSRRWNRASKAWAVFSGRNISRTRSGSPR